MRIKLRRIISQTTKQELDEAPWGKVDQEFLVLALFVGTRSGLSAYIQAPPYNEPGFFALDGFEVLSQYISSTWVMRVTANNVISFLPKNWAYESFFDEVENGDLKAIELFNQETEKMYIEEGLI